MDKPVSLALGGMAVAVIAGIAVEVFGAKPLPKMDEQHARTNDAMRERQGLRVKRDGMEWWRRTSKRWRAAGRLGERVHTNGAKQ